MEHGDKQQVRVGVGVMVFKNGKVLFAKRKGSHGEGEYAFPCGHLEYMESFSDCAMRETREECGIEIGNIRFQFLANVIAYAPKHYTHINLIADWVSGEPEVLEVTKSESWDWYDLDHLPNPLFEFCRIAVEFNRTGENYYDTSTGDIGDFMENKIIIENQKGSYRSFEIENRPVPL